MAKAKEVAKVVETKAEKPKVKTVEEREKELQAKYPNQKIVKGSMQWDEDAQKWAVKITCQHTGCKAERKVFTSDLFQVRYCKQHVKEARKAANKAKRAATREALKAATPKA